MNDRPTNVAASAPTRSALPGGSPRLPRSLLTGAAAVVVALAGAFLFFLADPRHAPAPLDRLIEDLTGANPRPVQLLRPPVQPLSALATIGREIFNDRSLSASGRQSCASCHSPDHAFGPPPGRAIQLGGRDMAQEGLRPPPSLAYLYRQDVFGIGAAAAEADDPVPLDQLATQAQSAARATKSAGLAPAAPALVPRGGLFWDGREDTLMAQAHGPMTNPAEMANTDMYAVARRLAQARYRDLFKPLFGEGILDNPAMLFTEAMSALSRYQIEAQAFHRFDSKYDRWLEGKARLTRGEMRGLRLFNDPAKGNCAGCHLSQPSRDGLPPLFTDTEYEALGVPRNPAIRANRDPAFFDLGLCGPLRTDLARQTQYCGLFLTPSLRNSARRGVYFHNGVYHSLQDVMAFYNRRDTDPARVYPRDASGKVSKYNDLPVRYRGNVDIADAPFDRAAGGRPALTQAEIADIIAFLATLDDGYRPSGR